MPKKAQIAKTRKAVSKRFKVTGSGKVIRRRKGRRHLAEVKSRKRKRNLARPGLVSEADLPMIKECLPFSSK